MLKGSPYIFYSCGKIYLKGLGERQTYFVEPLSSDIELQLDVVCNNSGEVGGVPVVNIDGETGPSTSMEKEEVLRSPSFVTYKKCTMVTTPSVQFLQNLFANPTYESNDEHNLRPKHSSGRGLEKHWLTTPGTSPTVSPSKFCTESPESQMRKNKIVPHAHTSRSELRPPPSVQQEVPDLSESGRVSRNANSSGTIINAFISKAENGTRSSVDPNTAGPGNGGSEHENSSNHSESSDYSTNERSNRRAKKAKCVIS